jgi:hypothetical protein
MRIRMYLFTLALAGAGLTACGGGNGEPNPTNGTLDVVLTAAPIAPGAIMFTVSGGQIDGVTSNYTMYQTATATNSRKVLLTGPIVAGTAVQIEVPDVDAVDNYVVQVLQVAARSTAANPYQNLGTGSFQMDVQ